MLVFMTTTIYPSDRRSRILDAALECFLAKGYAATSIADIRKLSGASTGSIYHFFTGKNGLAETLLRDSTAGWASVSGIAVTPSAPAEQAIKASVHGLVEWGLSHPAHLRFMVEIRDLAASDPELASVRTLLTSGQASASANYARMSAQGAVKNLPWPVAYALMMGPAYTYLRSAPHPGPGQVEPLAALFAEAAWQSVRFWHGMPPPGATLDSSPAFLKTAQMSAGAGISPDEPQDQWACSPNRP